MPLFAVRADVTIEVVVERADEDAALEYAQDYFEANRMENVVIVRVDELKVRG